MVTGICNAKFTKGELWLLCHSLIHQINTTRDGTGVDRLDLRNNMDPQLLDMIWTGQPLNGPSFHTMSPRMELKSDSIKSTSRDIIRPQPTTPPPPHPHHPRVAVLLLLRGDKM